MYYHCLGIWKLEQCKMILNLIKLSVIYTVYICVKVMSRQSLGMRTFMWYKCINYVHGYVQHDHNVSCHCPGLILTVTSENPSIFHDGISLWLIFIKSLEMLFIEDPIIDSLENYSINKLSPLYITVNFVHQISIIINNFINNSKNFPHIPIYRQDSFFSP